jgi:hypothetical protein
MVIVDDHKTTSSTWSHFVDSIELIHSCGNQKDTHHNRQQNDDATVDASSVIIYAMNHWTGACFTSFVMTIAISRAIKHV